jgi:hypothetical protein
MWTRTAGTLISQVRMQLEAWVHVRIFMRCVVLALGPSPAQGIVLNI